MRFVFSVYDSAAKYFRDPFIATTKGEALSQFMEAVNHPESYLAKRPADFTLFLMCSFDEEIGQFILPLSPESMGIAIEFKREEAVPLKLEKTGTPT